MKPYIPAIIILIAISAILGIWILASKPEQTRISISSNIPATPPTKTPSKTPPVSPPATPAPAPTYTAQSVSLHNNANDCWTIVSGFVYDITSYINQHPGGRRQIIQSCGIDSTDMFYQVSQHSNNTTQNLLQQFELGKLQT